MTPFWFRIRRSLLSRFVFFVVALVRSVTTRQLPSLLSSCIIIFAFAGTLNGSSR